MAILGLARSIVAYVGIGAFAAFSGVTWAPATAHEVRPAYLELKQQADDIFDVLFKTPMQGELRLALSVSISGVSQALTPVLSRVANDAMIQTWTLQAPGSLAGRDVRVVGLDRTLSDALLRIEYLDGQAWTQRLTPASPGATIPAAATGFSVAWTYGGLGVEHILTGFDHLLFVLGLCLLSRGLRQLFFAVTAFTMAHSVTLAAATLGLVHVPQRAVEAVIALSIVFVAAEIIHARHGKAGLAARAPWLAAFAFGLLHGFGFAGALSEVGLPQGYIPTALFFFNLGVEAGQMAFVAAVLAASAVLRRLWRPIPAWARVAPPYLIGSLAMFWVIQRVSQF
ncbi:MAG: HupE/UreJ family protein [Beijerinckiaceae bacterium]|nr:HupE/UreJ family protein [Beijerinckiaceae bacterium]MBX9758007.1 HupE/UreJ family protein [Beijerinckiaceae bacterium]MDO9442098.1 HupE/UreJ family protein [Beijerinckiaceae bacterium]